MADFPEQPLADALEAALETADHLEPKHAATVVAARVLAQRIDTWQVIVEWALDDAGPDGRPKVPANDNTSLPTFLKYLEALQLIPQKAPVAGKGAPADVVDELKSRRQKSATGS